MAEVDLDRCPRSEEALRKLVASMRDADGCMSQVPYFAVLFLRRCEDMNWTPLGMASASSERRSGAMAAGANESFSAGWVFVVEMLPSKCGCVRSVSRT